jgi:hypothetical protein
MRVCFVIDLEGGDGWGVAWYLMAFSWANHGSYGRLMCVVDVPGLSPWM